MFRDRHALVQSIFTDTGIGRIWQKGYANLVMTPCAPPHLRKRSPFPTSFPETTTMFPRIRLFAASAQPHKRLQQKKRRNFSNANFSI